MDLEDANRDSDRERSLTAGHGEGARLSIQREELEVHRTRERQRESVRIARNPLTRGPFGPTEATHERESGGGGTTSIIRGTWHSITLPLELCDGVYSLSFFSFIQPPKKKTLARAAIERSESVDKIGVDGATLDLPPIPIDFFFSPSTLQTFTVGILSSNSYLFSKGSYIIVGKPFKLATTFTDKPKRCKKFLP